MNQKWGLSKKLGSVYGRLMIHFTVLGVFAIICMLLMDANIRSYSNGPSAMNKALANCRLDMNVVARELVEIVTVKEGEMSTYAVYA